MLRRSFFSDSYLCAQNVKGKLPAKFPPFRSSGKIVVDATFIKLLIHMKLILLVIKTLVLIFFWFIVLSNMVF